MRTSDRVCDLLAVANLAYTWLLAKVEALKTLAKDKKPQLFPQKLSLPIMKEPETPANKSGSQLVQGQRRGSHTTDILKKSKNQQSQDSSLDYSGLHDREKSRLMSANKHDSKDRDDALSDRSDSSIMSLQSSFRNLMMKKAFEKQRRIDAMKKAEDLSLSFSNSCRQKLQNKEQKYFSTVNKNRDSFHKLVK